MIITCVVPTVSLSKQLTAILVEFGHKVHCCRSVAEAKEGEPDLIFAEWEPGSVRELFRCLGAAKEPPIVVLGPGECVAMERARNLGALDCLVYPVDKLEIQAILQGLCAPANLPAGGDLRAIFEDMRRNWLIGNSPRFQKCLEAMYYAAQTKYNVLLLGETGTGKEKLAEGIHCLSPHCRGPFKACNCAALPENLIETELFGSVPGAFTGATDREGFF
jgi:DNA-binding NtrC family response regulator